MAETFTLKLVARKPLADNTDHLVFERADGQPLCFQPGQFIQLHFPCGEATAKRSYSIASIPCETPAEGEQPCCDQIEIAVSWVEGGLATTCLQQLQTGEDITATGPLGRFCLPEESVERYVLVGTGTGITPYRAMWPEIRRRMAEGTRFALLFGARKPQDLIYEADFLAMQAESAGRFQYLPCLSREPRLPPRPEDFHGYVQERFDNLNPDPEADVFYLCGNPDMVDAAAEKLRGLGFPSGRIRREKYLSPKR